MTLNYIGSPTEEGQSYTFKTGVTTYESIHYFTGSIINVGSYIWASTSESEGGILDMGITSLASVTIAPTEWYSDALTSTETELIGHVACIKTTTNQYAKIYFTSFESSGNQTNFTFDWVYQPDGSRNF